MGRVLTNALPTSAGNNPQFFLGGPCRNGADLPFSLRPRNWPTGTIVATCNPPDDNQDHGDAVGQDIGEFDARFREHHVDLLDQIIPLSVSDPC